jgi:uncharacterized protein (TIGR00369 family)
VHILNNNFLIKKYVESNNFGRLLGIYFEIVEAGKVHYFATINESHLATPNATHGGFIATLCDGALGIAALSKVVENSNVVSTIEFNVKFLRPINLGDKIVVIGETISSGKRIIFSECKVLNQKNELVAIATGTFNVYPSEKAGY